MKISKVQLRRIIKEELAKLTESKSIGGPSGKAPAPWVEPVAGKTGLPTLDDRNTSAVKADVPSTGGRRAGETGPKGTPSIPAPPKTSWDEIRNIKGDRGPGNPGNQFTTYTQYPAGSPIWPGIDAQASVGVSGEKEIEGVGTIHGSADLPIVRASAPGSDDIIASVAQGDDPGSLGAGFEEPTGPRLSAGYSTKGSTYGLPFGWDIGGDLTMTTGGKAPLLGGEINLSKEIGDYSMKVRNTYGDFDLAKGIQGRMVGASLGRNIGNAHIEAGLDIPKGEGGLPSLDQAQAFLQAGGDLGSLSVILGPDLLQTRPGLNFQLDLIGVGRKLGLIKNNNLEEATLKRWKKLIK